MKLSFLETLYRKFVSSVKIRPFETHVRTEAERHQEILEEAQSLLERLASPQNHLYFKRKCADETMPDFDPQTYFEARGMIAEEHTLGLLENLLELYVNALKNIDDFSLRKKYLSAPYLKMGANLLEASAEIERLRGMFAENLESLRRYMIINGMIESVILFSSKES